MNALLGGMLKRKAKDYTYPHEGKKYKFGVLIDETDLNFLPDIPQLSAHPFFNTNSMVLAFSNPEAQSRFKFSYHKKELPWNQWPIKADVEEFVCSQFDYFLPIINKWQLHHKIIAQLVQAKVKICHVSQEKNLPWNLSLCTDSNQPIDLLKFAMEFVD